MSVHACSSPRGLAGWAFAALMALATGPASAALLWQQLPEDQGEGYFANVSTPAQFADYFPILSASASLEMITWWGGYYDGVDAGDDDFLVRLLSSTTGTGIVEHEFSSPTVIRVSTGLSDAVGNSVYRYDFALTAPLSVSSSNRYLSVQNLGSSDWFWLASLSGNGLVSTRGEDGDEWVNLEGVDVAFQIEGTPAQAPEPSSLALLGMAALSMALAGRQRHKA